MHAQTIDPRYDLRVHPPRSPRAQIAGLVMAARTADKIRAKLQGTLGPYKIGPGLSVYLFEWLGITEEQFTQAVRASPDDAGIAEWLTTHCDTTRFAEINERFIERGIRDEEHRRDVLPRYPILAERPELRNWFDILEADDQQLFPSSS